MIDQTKETEQHQIFLSPLQNEPVEPFSETLPDSAYPNWPLTSRSKQQLDSPFCVAEVKQKLLLIVVKLTTTSIE